MENQENREIKIFMKENEQLYFSKEGQEEVPVSIKKTFPWSMPRNYLSLRDKDDNEVFLVDSLDNLDELTRGLIERNLRLVEFVMDITQIIKIEEDLELRQFEVITVQGERVFQTELEAWPEIRRDGSILIRDVAGDLFRVRSFEELDGKSQKILQTYVS